MRLSEQEIVNAICLHMAERKRLQPNQVEVEMMWDEDSGFSAEVHSEGRSQIIIAANILEAIECDELFSFALKEAEPKD